MAAKNIQVSLPDALSGFVRRTVKSGRYRDAGEVVREALRRMETSELAEELRQFEQAFVGGNERAETEEDVRRVEAAVHVGRNR